MPSAAFCTLGCKVNQYETQRILESFEEAGFSIVAFDAPADVYVVNSCSVTAAAESKSRYTIRRARRSNPDAKVVVTGCAAQMAANQGQGLADADLLVPNPEKMDTLRRVLDAFPVLRGELHAVEPGTATRLRPLGRTRATLKVQDGCNVMCSYCSIPFTRPGMTSRPWKDVLEEARIMTGQGYREAVLTGVLIGSYGPETGSGGPCFEDLVEILAERSGLERIRISSIEMRQVTPRLASLVRQGAVVPHLHIPLQSGDDGVLRDMGRPYTQAEYVERCLDLKAEIPDLSITTDILVGFPTETPERFESSVHVCETVRFLKAHVFSFSPRPGTPAARWGDRVDPTEKQRRREVLSQISARTGAERVRTMVGQTVRVLVERVCRKDGLLEGLTDHYVPVHFAGPNALVRQICWVEVGEERDGTAFGELAIGPAPERSVRLRVG